MGVRIAFIGTGNIATKHIVNLFHLQGVEVVALCDLSLERIHAVKEAVFRLVIESDEGKETAFNHKLETFRNAAIYTDYRLMLLREWLDAVYVCLPPFAHGEPEEAIIEAGLPIFVEKPVALDLSLASRILLLLRQKGLIAASGYQSRYAVHLQEARRLLANRTIGMAVVMRFGRTPPSSWYHIQSQSGGQVTEMATHQIDLLRYLIGEVETIYSAAATRINNRTQPDYDIFDVNCATLTFGNRAVCNFSTNMISGYGKPSQARGLHIFCDNLTLSVLGQEDEKRLLQLIFPDRTEEMVIEADSMAIEDRAFIQAVEERRPDLILSDYENGIRTLAVTVANDRSARTGQPIHIPTLLNSEAPEVYRL